MMKHRQHCPALENIRRPCWCPTLDQVADDTRTRIADRVRALPTMGNGGDAMLYRSAVLDAIRNAP